MKSSTAQSLQFSNGRNGLDAARERCGNGALDFVFFLHKRHKWSSSAQLVQSMPFSAVQRPAPSHALARLDGAPDAEGETTSVAQLNVKQCQNEPAIQLKKTGG